MGEGDQKRKILLAAEKVLYRHGLTGATLDMMAAEADLTKGGIFYYFDGKRDVVMGILDLYLERLREEREQHLSKLPATGHAFFKATVLTMLDQMARSRASMSNMGGILDVPEYRDRVMEIKNEIFAEVAERYPNDKIAIAFVIMDGMWMNNMFKSDVYYQGCRKAVEDNLMQFVDSLE